MRYSSACGSYHDFLDRVLPTTRKLLNQGFTVVKLSHHFESFTIAIMTWLIVIEYQCHKWPRICSVCRHRNPVLSSFMTYLRMCNKSNTTVPRMDQELPILPEHLRSSLVLVGGHVAQSLVFCVVCSLLLFVFLSFCV